MSTPLKILLVCAITAAFGIGFLVGKSLRLQPEEPGLEPAADSADAGDLQRLQQLLELREAELARMRADRASGMQPAGLDRVPEAAPVAADALPTEDERPRRGGGFNQRMEAFVANRVAELSGKLGLTEAQQTAIKELYQQQSERFQAMRSGEDVAPLNFDGAMSEILNDEQFEAYLEESQQEIYNRAEMMATMQSVRLNQVVPMSPAQQEMVYEAIHFTTQEMLISRQAGETFELRTTLEDRLSTILDPDQMAAYRENASRGGFGRGFGMP